MRPEGMSRTLSSFGNQYRAPLTVIFSMLTLLSRNCGPGSSEKDRERMPDYLAAINQSAFRLLRSSEWISDYTRLTYGFSPVRTRRVDLFHYLRELFSAAADLIEPTGIPLSADIPEGMLPAACDTQKVSAALLNILSIPAATPAPATRSPSGCASSGGCSASRSPTAGSGFRPTCSRAS